MPNSKKNKLILISAGNFPFSPISCGQRAFLMSLTHKIENESNETTISIHIRWMTRLKSWMVGRFIYRVTDLCHKQVNDAKNENNNEKPQPKMLFFFRLSFSNSANQIDIHIESGKKRHYWALERQILFTIQLNLTSLSEAECLSMSKSIRFGFDVCVVSFLAMSSCQ